jgi:hypothetical protein
VDDVVFHEEEEGGGGVVADEAAGVDGGGVGVLDDVGEMEVVAAPEFEEVVPVEFVVVLRGDPLVLLVGGEDEFVGELAADETLVVVGGGVDEVAEDFFDGPAVGRGAVGDNGGGEGMECGGGGFDSGAEVVRDLGGPFLI